MLGYQSILDALAAGATDVAYSLASVIGGRDALERKNDHPFDRAFGYAMKFCVLDEADALAEASAHFIEACGKKGNRVFAGYADMIEAIRIADADRAAEALQSIVEGHERRSKGGGRLADTYDSLLSVWGIGTVNLARSKGLTVSEAPPLIPADLLI